MKVVTKDESSGRGPPERAPDGSGDTSAPGSDEIIRLGDEHGKGAEGLCVGESQ
jgi:hypothetical protein